MDRADRVAARLPERRARPAAGHRPHEPALPDGLHRLQRHGRGRPRRAPLRDRLPLRRAGGRSRSPASTASRARRTSSTALAEGWPRGRAAARLRGRPRVRAPPRAAARGAARPDRARRRRAGSSRPSGRSRTAARSSGSPPPPRWPTHLRLAARVGARRAHRARGRRSRSSTRCACAGASGPSFPSIVASGRARRAPARRRPPTSRSRAARWSRSTSGAVLDGYCSDCTRTWATGELPDDLAEAYALVAARAAGRAGRGAARAARAARSTPWRATMIAEAGHGEHFGHGLGHGVGLEVHEAPRLARTARTRSWPGNVVTVEPGVYLPGRGGVRIEDLVVVTRRRLRRPQRHDQGPDRRGIGLGSRAQARAPTRPISGRDGTSSPHSPSRAPRRHDGGPRRPPRARHRGHRHRRRRQEEKTKLSGGHFRSPDDRRGRRDARDPRAELRPRPQQEHRGVQARRRARGVRQGAGGHREAAARDGAGQAAGVLRPPQRRARLRRASACACSPSASRKSFTPDSRSPLVIPPRRRPTPPRRPPSRTATATATA